MTLLAIRIARHMALVNQPFVIGPAIVADVLLVTGFVFWLGWIARSVF